MAVDKDHVARLRKMMDQVNPGFATNALDEQLKSLRVRPATAGDVRFIEAVRQESQFALESLRLLRDEHDDQIDSDRRFALEAIVMPYYRPVIDIVDDKNAKTATYLHVVPTERR